jgi:AGZA family xanthine/uracil permease-like MFS transporter
MQSSTFKYRWFVKEDFNGFFGLMFDNITVMSFLAGLLIFVFQYPADIVYGRMLPGTALGVLVGDVVYTIMAYNLAKRTKNPNVTAMPLGLDTPSTIGIALTVLGPAFIYLKGKGMNPYDAAMMTWYIGMATMVLIGIIKTVCSFIGGWIQKIVPQAGLLGSLAGIGLALIGFVPLIDIFGLPVIGLISLGLILYTVIAKMNLPGKFPGIFAAILFGTILYYILAPLGLLGVSFSMPSSQLHFGFPLPSLGFIQGFGEALKYLPIAFPFAILTVVGGINTTESAKVAGDDYNTRNILLTEAISTFIAGIFGGVAQTTPYIGQPAYKEMGSRAGYTLLTGLFIGLGGILGYTSFIIELIPRAVLAPILVFVALDIISQAFIASPKKHAPAVAFAFFPIVARLLQIKLSNTEWVPVENFAKAIAATGKALPEMLVTVALGNGFILTAMLWGGFLAVLINKELKKCAAFLVLTAILTFFGLIHSALPEGSMYLPWTLPVNLQTVPYQFTAGYLILALMIYGLSFYKGRENPEAGPVS